MGSSVLSLEGDHQNTLTKGGGRVSSFMFPYSIIKNLFVVGIMHHLFVCSYRNSMMEASKWHTTSPRLALDSESQLASIRSGTNCNGHMHTCTVRDKFFSSISAPIDYDRLVP